ncbi:hypothetical protein [Nocardia phage P3.1]|nr:hypothetical protein [Nocardia phage P3.1]
MATIVQEKEGRTGIIQHERGNVIDMHMVLNDWFDFFKHVDGMRPMWTSSGFDFVVRNSLNNKIVHRFRVEAY